MLKARARQFQSLILAADVALPALVFLALVAQAGAAATPPEWPGAARLLFLGLVASLAWPVVLSQMGFYGSTRRASLDWILGRLLVAGCVATSLLGTAVVALGAPLPPLFAVRCGLAQLGALAALRLAIFTGLRLLRRSGRNTRNVLVVGSGPQARRVQQGIQQHPEWGLHVLGFLDESDVAVDPLLAAEKVHKLHELPRLLSEYAINEVILAIPRSMLESIVPVVGLCATTGVPVTLLADLFGDVLPPPRVARFDAQAALCFAPVHHGRIRLALKRWFDVAGASLLLLALLPVLAAAALLIRLTSSGPVLFWQIRCGLNGRPFVMLKLRTMCADAEERKRELLAQNEAQGPVFKLRRDPRVTRVGRVLRRWSIDELPQLWNVLKGDMSLVGPRPPVPLEVAEYAPAERRRLSMRPGLTCIWQVSGRSTVAFADWVKLDLRYIDSGSLAQDLRLLLKTVPAVIRGVGAS
jgi:exopolysaccharide biosynthesis polyprenyl glycosylphosphotransferase